MPRFKRLAMTAVGLGIIQPTAWLSLPATLYAQSMPFSTGQLTGAEAGNLASDYILGPGDQLAIEFFNVPEYNGEKGVLVDGTLNMPLVGKVEVSGLTVEGATNLLNNIYAPYLRTPLITLQVITPRPIKIGISGEVNRPGSYEIPLGGDGDGDGPEWPTVVEAVQLAGGITDRADVREVEIRRQGPGPATQAITLDFWEMLNTGNISQDITLRHGDAVYIPTAKALTPEELTQLSEANFSPDAIRVSVVGEVGQPGLVEVPPNAPLTQALLAAGGFDTARADQNEVELVRLNPDGTVTQRVIPITFEQGINDETNPSLKNNDVIIVGRSGGAAFSDTVGTLFGPLGAILSPLNFFLNLFD
jgi:polysaccharide export outer membrane protein